ncbi:alpha/beta hydrolase domain-containing protein [Fulvimarina sp. MAC8]|uniref:alpha/beta hydrolase domain-containing protein n=1 Tax=Fulvimarina sp. MAC8 TaxID=3162874 RepID=UPI0032EDDCB7
MNRTGWLLSAAMISLVAASGTDSQARVVGFEVESREAAYEGKSFGKTGAYERIDATAHLAIDPKSERGQTIVDLDKAPVNANGEVEFSTRVTILTPTDASKGSGTMFYEVPNRGRNLSFALLNFVTSVEGTFSVDDPGDGFLMSEGHTLVWSGWQTGLDEGSLQMELPVLPEVTGQSREEFIFDKDGETQTVSLTYPAASTEPGEATLTVRAKPGDERSTPDGVSFRYLDETSIEITRPESMDDGAIYEFIYPAKDALPMGLAFVATADVVSFLRGNGGGEVENPISGINHTIGMGISQSGRFLRDFIYQGFNADEGGAQVFDGAMPHIAGSRKTFTNYSFAQPGRYSRQHEDHDYPGDQFPFTYAETSDPLSGESGSILTACEETDTCPLVIHTDTSTEFWQARSSLVSTSPSGEALTMPDGVRLYFIAGAPHFNAWESSSKENETCVYPSNPASAAPTMRALVANMEAWVTGGETPPDSVFPGLSGDDIVAPDALELPVLDGERPSPMPNPLAVMDHSSLPPKAGETYDVMVPKTDEDGLPMGGVEEPVIAAPIGTYWGWNLRAEGFAPGDLCSLTGSFVAFPKEDGSNSDARTPLSERYADADAYRSEAQAAAEALVEKRLMRAEDVETIVDSATARFETAVQ